MLEDLTERVYEGVLKAIMPGFILIESGGLFYCSLNSMSKGDKGMAVFFGVYSLLISSYAGYEYRKNNSL